ncbi:hypothetical protein [Acinetobacter beijerinckii]|uniref:hypothetical protein n=1 Tax=Acinetobacter beijerinckii TaxID=262668 RepID=UPI0003A0AAA3|nr:hypothetical protein [Acinetobacter beijerinckii]
MKKSKTSIFICIILLGGIVLSTGCETEQKKDKSSSPMVSYNEDFVKKQAQLINEGKNSKDQLINSSSN